MLKIQLHIHSKEDPRDTLSCTAKDLIDEAVEQKFDVMAFTCHNKVIHTPELEQYAKSKNILLISGVERNIERKEVLLYNITEEESQSLTTFQELIDFKKKQQQQNKPFLVIAPHPFYFGPPCLKKKVIEYLDLFDAWEYSFFHTKWINPNKKMAELAQEHHKPVIGNSDVHKAHTLERTYSLLDSEKNIPAIFQAIKDDKIEIKTTPLSFISFAKLFVVVSITIIKRWLKKEY
ncbi:PHP domain-containing protein [Candidatus Woesearchaeota archaeon]|nr:PHP domain-containing protein [Candidatus Woesearchaeota archaeon]